MGHWRLLGCVGRHRFMTTQLRSGSPWRFLHTSPVCCGSQSTSKPTKSGKIDAKQLSSIVSAIPLERMRNFSIIAHIDHGKSTLADRLLEITGAIKVNANAKNEQILDKLQVERERGITVKAQTASLVYSYKGEDYLLNLIDTPGHVDFNFEVARSLSACQGVILLVDANQGVQAQTVANFFLAFEKDLVIVPVMNKIDLQVARPDEVEEQIQNVFEIPADEVLRISAKLGTGIEEVIHAVIQRIPPPPGDAAKPFQALFFDSSYDRYRGVIANIAVKNGVVKKGDKIVALHSEKIYDVQEVGILQADEKPTEQLTAGQVGYLIGGIRKTSDVLIGDTFCNAVKPAEALPGFKPAKPMVFAGVFPIELSEYSNLKSSLDKLLINDCSIQVNSDNSAALGPGWRLGFLGLLHMEVFTQRLEQEFGTSVIVTTPNVPYKVKIHGAQNIKHYGKEELTVLNPCLLPDRSIISEYHEPYVQGTIISPDTYLSGIMSILMDRRAQNITQNYIDNKRIMFKAVLPLSEIIVDFFDALKALSSGYASFDYEDFGYQLTDLIKIDIYLNGQLVEELAQIVHFSRALTTAKHMTHKLQESLPRQMFEIAIQAKMGSKVLSRMNVKAYRKDVTAKLYGGDVTRRMKLLKRQAEGKKKMRRIGNIDVPKETFIDVLKK